MFLIMFTYWNAQIKPTNRTGLHPQCSLMESVLPWWFQTHIGFLHVFRLLFLDLVVSFSFCCHNLIVVVTDQFLWSLQTSKQLQSMLNPTRWHIIPVILLTLQTRNCVCWIVSKCVQKEILTSFGVTGLWVFLSSSLSTIMYLKSGKKDC